MLMSIGCKTKRRGMKMSKKLLTMLIMGFMFFWIIGTNVIAYAVTINIDTLDTSIVVGETVYIDFTISGLSSAPGDSLSAFDFDILFDDSVFLLTSFDFSDPILGNNQLDLPESGAWPFDGDVKDNGNGILDAYGVSGNTASFLDAYQASDFRFLGLTFLAVAEAPISSISIDLNDPSLLVLDSSWNDLNVNYASSQLDFTISTNAPVPEPATILLFATGLLPLLSKQLRKKFV